MLNLIENIEQKFRKEKHLTFVMYNKTGRCHSEKRNKQTKIDKQTKNMFFFRKDVEHIFVCTE